MPPACMSGSTLNIPRYRRSPCGCRYTQPTSWSSEETYFRITEALSSINSAISKGCVRSPPIRSISCVQPLRPSLPRYALLTNLTRTGISEDSAGVIAINNYLNLKSRLVFYRHAIQAVLLHNHNGRHRFYTRPKIQQPEILILCMLVIIMIGNRNSDRRSLQVFFEQIQWKRAAHRGLQHQGVCRRTLYSISYPPDYRQVH